MITKKKLYEEVTIIANGERLGMSSMGFKMGDCLDRIEKEVKQNENNN